MNEADAPDGLAGDAIAGRERLTQRFTTLWEEHAARVKTIVGSGKYEDPDALVGEVARKAWQAFPTTVKRERLRMRDGWPGYNWAKWFAQTAERVVIDAKLERLVDEDLARFEEIERILLPAARNGNAEAMDRWLRLQAARAQRVGHRNGGSMLEAGVAVGDGAPGVRAIEVLVRYVDNWRTVRDGVMGVGVGVGVGVGSGVGDLPE